MRIVIKSKYMGFHINSPYILALFFKTVLFSALMTTYMQTGSDSLSNYDSFVPYHFHSAYLIEDIDLLARK